MWDGTALSLHTLYSQAPENEATPAWDTKGATKDKSPCRLLCWGSWPMNRIAFLSIWARSKVLYEHSWLNKLEESVPSSLAAAMRMEYQCNTKDSRRKTEIGMEKIENLMIKAKSIFHPDLTSYYQTLNEYHSSNSIWQETCKSCWNDTKHQPCKLLCHFYLFPNLCSYAFGQLSWPLVEPGTELIQTQPFPSRLFSHLPL